MIPDLEAMRALADGAPAGQHSEAILDLVDYIEVLSGAPDSPKPRTARECTYEDAVFCAKMAALHARDTSSKRPKVKQAWATESLAWSALATLMQEDRQ